MNVDWFTVAAQLINFFILVWLLKKFLYKPVLDAVDAREKLIEQELTSARTQQENATKERTVLDQKMASFDQQKQAAWEENEKKISDQRKTAFEKLSREADERRTQLNDSLIEQQQQLAGLIQKNIQEEVVAVSRKVLTELGSASLEQEIVKHFMEELRQSDKKSLAFLQEASAASTNITVTTAFSFPEEGKKGLEDLVNSITGRKSSFVYRKDEALICGIQLSVKDYSISWDIAKYLQGIDGQMKATLKN